LKGEFSKRIYKFADEYGLTFHHTPDPEISCMPLSYLMKGVNKIIKEALKDHPKMIDVVYGDRMEEYNREIYEADEIDEWLTKWFIFEEEATE